MTDVTFNSAVSQLNEKISSVLLNIDERVKSETQEVRLRVGQPIQLIGEYKTLFLKRNSQLCLNYDTCDLFIPTAEEIKDSLNKICEFSLHTHIKEIQNGFITIDGGHRVGISGTAVSNENGVYNIKDISSLNLRIAHQIIGCSNFIDDNVLFSKHSIIIAGAPLSGKTTVLRDIARRLSKGGKKVLVIDERNEISATKSAIPNNDLGPCCDVLTFFQKEMGIMLGVRSLSPEVIVCDEIGDLKETNAVIEGFHSGVRFILSIHANSIETLKLKPQFVKLKESGEFGYVVFLNRDKHEIITLR